MVILVGGTGLFLFMPHLHVFTNFYCDTEYNGYCSAAVAAPPVCRLQQTWPKAHVILSIVIMNREQFIIRENISLTRNCAVYTALNSVL
jgi:hypothetical protein